MNFQTDFEKNNFKNYIKNKTDKIEKPIFLPSNEIGFHRGWFYLKDIDLSFRLKQSLSFFVN